MMAVVTHYAVGELTEKSGIDGAPAAGKPADIA